MHHSYVVSSTHTLIQGYTPYFLTELWHAIREQRSKERQLLDRFQLMWAIMRYLTAIQVQELLTHVSVEETPKGWSAVAELIMGLQDGKKLSWGVWSKALTVAVKLNVKHLNSTKRSKVKHQLTLPELARRLNKHHQDFERLVVLRNINSHSDRSSLEAEEREELKQLTYTYASMLEFHRRTSLIYLHKRPERRGGRVPYELISERGPVREVHKLKGKVLDGLFEYGYAYLLSLQADRLLCLSPWLLIDQHSHSRHLTYLLSEVNGGELVYQFEPKQRPEEELKALKEEVKGMLDALLSTERDLPSVELPTSVHLSVLQPQSAPEPKQVKSYKILEKVGHGGYGAVYLVQHKRSTERYALKLLHPALSQLPKLHRRFEQECALLQKLKHPNLVEYVEWGVDDRHGPYAVTEHLSGGTLEDLARLGLSSERLISQMLELLEALSYLHQQDVIHRDLKPSNIMFTQDGQLKLIDFGIALEEGSERLTQTLEVLGTKRFAAPEQLRGNGEVDQRSDLYSVGKTLLYISAQMSEETPPMLSAIAQKASHIDPNRRYSSAQALATALKNIAKHNGKQPLLAGELIQNTRIIEPLRLLKSGYWIYLGKHELNGKTRYMLTEQVSIATPIMSVLSKEDLILFNEHQLTIDHMERGESCTVIIFEDAPRLMERLVTLMKRWLNGDSLSDALKATQATALSPNSGSNSSSDDFLTSLQAYVTSLSTESVNESALLDELKDILERATQPVVDQVFLESKQALHAVRDTFDFTMIGRAVMGSVNDLFSGSSLTPKPALSNQAGLKDRLQSTLLARFKQAQSEELLESRLVQALKLSSSLARLSLILECCTLPAQAREGSLALLDVARQELSDLEAVAVQLKCIDVCSHMSQLTTLKDELLVTGVTPSLRRSLAHVMSDLEDVIRPFNGSDEELIRLIRRSNGHLKLVNDRFHMKVYLQEREPTHNYEDLLLGHCVNITHTCERCGVGQYELSGERTSRCDIPSCGHEVERCPRCRSGHLKERTNKYSDFMGCSNYKNQLVPCRYTRSM